MPCVVLDSTDIICKENLWQKGGILAKSLMADGAQNLALTYPSSWHVGSHDCTLCKHLVHQQESLSEVKDIWPI